MKRPIRELFEERVQKGDGCWLWTGSFGSHGYGEIGRTRRWLAHRLSWHLHVGPIPDGLFVLHHCDTPACVRPVHLFLGTQADNNHDMWTKGRGPVGVRNGQGRKTHCPQGHEYNLANTYTSKLGKRYCRPCALHRYHAKRAAA